MDDTGTAVDLRDGSRVVVRLVRPDDRELLLAGFEWLGPESRYQRFFAPMAELTGDDVTYLTDAGGRGRRRPLHPLRRSP